MIPINEVYLVYYNIDPGSGHVFFQMPEEGLETCIQVYEIML